MAATNPQKLSWKLEIKNILSKLPQLKTLTEIIISLAILAVTSPLITVSLVVTLTIRLVLKYYFSLFTYEKYSLMAPEDAIFAYNESHANYSTLLTLSIYEGICDMEKIRNKTVEFANEKLGDGKVCKKFRQRITKIFGYYCWEDCSGTFDIKKVLRFVNGDENSTFCEEELLEILGKLSDGEINPGNDQPQWEIFVCPNYICNTDSSTGKQGNPHYAVISRMHHAYGDGISLTKRLEKSFGDSIVESKIDPFKPLNIPFHIYALAYLNMFLRGPYSILRTLSLSNQSFLYGGKLCGPKILGRTKPMKLDALKKIKSSTGTAVISILNCALTGTLRKLALRKREEITELPIHGGFTVAKFPYEWMKPQNKFSLIAFPINMSLDKVEDRLADCHSTAKNLKKSPDFLMNYYMIRFFALFPAPVIKFLHEMRTVSTIMTNVPGAEGPLTMFDGQLLVDAGAWPPLKSTTAIAFAVVSYNGAIRANVIFDGCILTDRKDMDFILESFTEEIIEMGKIAGIQEEDIIFGPGH